MKDDRSCIRLNAAFQYVDDKFLDIVEREKRRRRKKPVWLIFSTVAACICVLFALPVGVMAYNWFGLRDLLLQDSHGTENSESLNPGNENSGSGDIHGAAISLSGYRGSPEAQALKEWEEFQQHYDIDIGNDVFAAEEREDWSQYAVYSQEMGEKLDEIAAKYGLRLHREMNVVSAEELEYRVGGVFLAEDCTKYWGYIYENGAFHCEADVEIEGCGVVEFQFGRSVKGTLDDVVLYIEEVDGYTEWQYETSCGEAVLLASDPVKSLIFADFEDCFIAVNVLCGSSSGMTEENLQKLADKIDFTMLKEVRTPEMRGDSVPPRAEAETLEIGQMGSLGRGRLFYVISDQEGEDYKLYFYRTQDTDMLFDLAEYPPEEADYIFPDVREGNKAIGRFWQIYYSDMADITGDGMADFIIIARYEAEEGVYYDTRIYEWTEEGYLPNYEWMDELNRKYYNVEEYPVEQLIELPHD